MKKLFIPVMYAFLLGFMCMCSFKTADAANYTGSEFKTDYYISRNTAMHSDNDRLTVLDYKKQGKKNRTKITDSHIAEDGSVTTRTTLWKGDAYPIKYENSKLYVSRVEGKNLVVEIMNKKNRITSSYSIETDKMTKIKYDEVKMLDVKISGKKIYYLLYVRYKNDKVKCYLQCYDLKKKKVISSKKRGWYNGDYSIYEDDCLYTYDRVLSKCTVAGKKIKSYELPSGESSIVGHPAHLNITTDYNFSGIDFNGKYIYYCNRNGVYRCDTEGSKKFELIYDGSNDAVFNPPNGDELNLDNFEVLDNGDFYLFFGDYEDFIHKAYLYKADM